MEHLTFSNPALTIALGLATGIFSQSVAHHLRIPGIVLLLITGVLLGPDVGGVIQPETLGSALGIITGFAVAVILFEGGLNLKIQRLKRAKRAIRQMITIGGAVTVVGGMLSTHWFFGWDWRTCVLFGTLVMVTGPTVINPLLRRFRVKRNVSAVLEAEGVLLDAVGAVVAMVALEVALSPKIGPMATAVMFATRLGFGTLVGLLGGVLLVTLLKRRNVVPEGLENVFTLCMVFAMFQGANALLPESGIVAVTVAGVLVGNFQTYIQRELSEFKEALTVMLIGMLFILLAADVRLDEVYALGFPGIITVLVLMFVVRPINVVVGTFGTQLNWREKCFIGWIGPRGIVAAAIASLFAVELNSYGIAGGNELRALVFMVITVTVLSAGLTGGLFAQILDLRRPNNSGWVILGANELARAVAKILLENNEEVICIDANPDVCRAAEQDCTRVIFGNALKTHNLLRAEVDTRAGALAITGNEEMNLLFIQKVRKEAKLPHTFMALRQRYERVTLDMVHQTGSQVMFGSPRDVDFWSACIRKGMVNLERWQVQETDVHTEKGMENVPGNPFLSDHSGIPLTLRRNGRQFPIGDLTRFRDGDEVAYIVLVENAEKVNKKLQTMGWQRITSDQDRAFTLGLCPSPSYVK
ncbi:MAG: cation:proton antiporter [Desulfobacterales bacterium]|nr:MAG: cation:proton antiporter [Desulfobacterales bacterium]